MPVLDGMKAARVSVEISSERDDYNALAPEGCAPSKENKWLLFFYDPASDPQSHAAFGRLAADCFMHTVPPPEDEPETESRHAAICAFERVPEPPPEGEP